MLLSQMWRRWRISPSLSHYAKKATRNGESAGEWAWEWAAEEEVGVGVGVGVGKIRELAIPCLLPSGLNLAGRCVQCGSTDNLHFDHILPFSKGGTSLKAENIQLLCARYNLKKSDKIM